MSTCRVCGNSEYDKTHSKMIKYSTRHYAHWDCALDKWGATFFDRLNQWQLGQAPVMLLKRKGLRADFDSRYQWSEKAK